MKRLVALLALLLVSLSVTTAAWASGPVLRVRGVTWPGGIVYVSVEGQGLVSGVWKWAGHSGEMTKAPYGLRTALAIPLEASVGGKATLRVDVHTSQGPVTRERAITISDKWRPVQYLSMSSDNVAKYSDPQADREEVILLKALYDMRPGVMWRGGFINPSQGPRSSAFGVRRIRNGKTAGFHRGLDYADWEGALVTAAARGVVTLTGHGYTLLGNCVVLNHGEGLTTMYLHMSSISVAEGQVVEAGDEVGLVGSTGASTGPHLHYAAFFQGEPVDPDLLRYIPVEWAPEMEE